jgi:hypothetical protein
MMCSIPKFRHKKEIKNIDIKVIVDYAFLEKSSSMTLQI